MIISNLLKKISGHEAKNVSLAALILSVFSFLSFVLGLLRDRLITGRFGAGNELDAYYAAFRIPDFIAMVLMTGAIGVAVMPIFTKNLVKDKEEAFNYISNLLNLALVGLVVICGILFIFAPQLVSVIAPGFDGDKKEITTMMTRIMLLSPILMSISNIMSAILRVFQKFLITALAPIVYNLGSIVGIVFFVPRMGLIGLAWGIVLGACLHFLIQMPAFFRTGFKLKKIFNLLDKNFLLTLKLTIPRTIGLAASHVNLVVVTIIGSTLVPGSVGVFSLANDLSLPIIGLIAIPFATAVFPALSLAFSKGDRREMLNKFFSVFRQILFLMIPLSAIAFVLRAHFVRIAFGAGLFDWSATKLTAACFGVFMFGLFAQGLIYLVAKAFYAMHNTKIPALASVFSIITTVGFGYFFVWALGFQNFFSMFLGQTLKIDGMRNLAVVALPLAITVDAIIHLIVLLWFFKIKVPEFQWKDIFCSLDRILLATGLATIFTYIVRQLLGGYMGGETFLLLFVQTLVAGGLGLASYLVVAHFLKLPEAMALKNFALSQIGFLSNGKK